MLFDALWLQQCWNSRQVPPLTAQQWAQLIPILRREQMLARFALRCQLLTSVDVPDYARRHIQNAVRLAEKQQAQVAAEAELLQQLLAELDYCVYLKGAAYSLLASELGQGRLYSDIDILVPASQLTQAEQALCLHGFIPDEIDPYDDRYYRRWSHEIPPLRHANRRTVLDVHHQVIPPISGRAPELALLLSGLRYTTEGYVVLSAEAMFLHSALHLFCNEEIKHGWRDLLDLYLMLEDTSQAPDPKALIVLAESTGFSLELALALGCVAAQTNFPLPLEFTDWLAQQPRRQLLTWCFRQVLQAKMQPSFPRSLATVVLMVRGHWLKMPLVILVQHSLHKIWRSVAVAFIGDAAMKAKSATKSPPKN